MAFLKQALTLGSTEDDHVILLVPSALRSYRAGFSSLFSCQAANRLFWVTLTTLPALFSCTAGSRFQWKNLKNKTHWTPPSQQQIADAVKHSQGNTVLLEGTHFTLGWGTKKSWKRANKHHFKCIIMSNAYTNAISTYLLDLCSLVSQVSVVSVATVTTNDGRSDKTGVT